MKVLDLYILPSLQEGLSTGLLAAMAAGLPCVASAAGGIPELLGGGTGILVSPGDHLNLAAAIIELSTNLEARLDYSKRSSREAIKYDLEKTVDSIIRVYEGLVGRVDV
jgi:glycosyltransferase involved in cell wall biosynthesis